MIYSYTVHFLERSGNPLWHTVDSEIELAPFESIAIARKEVARLNFIGEHRLHFSRIESQQMEAV